MADATVHVKIEVRTGGGQVARVTIDDERRLNCLSTAQIERLTAAFRTLAGDRGLAAVVLTGAGTRAFVGG
ncbi:MAG: enoyl-CoA hydratase-related protein, partial [Hyphomicrobiaceae bacterium]